MIGQIFPSLAHEFSMREKRNTDTLGAEIFLDGALGCKAS
jgi:hypothetical protein